MYQYCKNFDILKLLVQDQQKHLLDNPMKHLTCVDQVVFFFILSAIVIFSACTELFSFFQKGIFINRRELLLSKTNKELRSILVGTKNISKMKKVQLVDLVLELS